MVQSIRALAAVVGLVLLLSNGALVASGEESPGRGEGPRAPQERVDLNSADEQELTAIPGIGEAIARRIVEWREEHGPFRRVEDLLKVKGIGEKSLQRLRPHVTVGESD